MYYHGESIMTRSWIQHIEYDCADRDIMEKATHILYFPGDFATVWHLEKKVQHFYQMFVNMLLVISAVLKLLFD